ncbi:hypothetical protein CANARDRAFT_7545 [[Candida] arabinofermentans NRRL YB-2248]|uniref:Rhodanese domain-containing protein n=1 Tax=[Candida] arabinofermentans NRRL YB-2248 TaxID=983967 RepID=A0A1E4T150_9ASCO|nr:hypothetical protein CANARDRAFT_7545 [[Candida] arabinofermentans NRRL YB-2248]
MFKTTSQLISRTSLGRRFLTIIPPAQAVSQLAKHDDSLIPLDASWYMPNVPTSAYHEFMKQRLNSRSVFFDIDNISDKSNPYPHMLPSKELFEKEVGQLGISNESTLLIYDQQGIFSACRAAWMFEIFGHDPAKIQILNTYPAYLQAFSDANLAAKFLTMNISADRTLVSKPSPLDPTVYTAKFQKSKVVLFEELVELVKKDKIGSDYTLIDARSKERFTGEAPEPRPGLSSGHIKGAKNLPFTDLLTENKSFLSSLSINSKVKALDIDGSKPIIVMCGTGVTACVIRSGLQAAGFDGENIAVYDGSWTEWAQRAPELIVKDV